MKLLYRSSYTNLDHITTTTYRVVLFGFTLIKWTTRHKARAADWN